MKQAGNQKQKWEQIEKKALKAYADPGGTSCGPGPVENRTILRGVSSLVTESLSEFCVITDGLSDRTLDARVPFLDGSSRNISILSFPGKEVALALWTERGVDGAFDVNVVIVEIDASEADVASSELSAVLAVLDFFNDERAGGGGSTTADMEARRVCALGRVRRWLCDDARGESPLRLLGGWNACAERWGRAWGVRDIWRPMAICSIVGRVSGLSWKLYGEGVGAQLSAGVEYVTPS